MNSQVLTKTLYFITSTVIDWVDIFTRPIYKHIILESLEYCEEHKRLEIYAWVLMTNHLHMIVGTKDDSSELTDILRDFKKFTSKQLMTALKDNEQESRQKWMIDRFWFAGNNDKKIKNFRFWQDGNHIEQIQTYNFYQQKLNYIHMNPVRQEIVARPEEYLYSSARDYAGEKGILKVIVQR